MLEETNIDPTLCTVQKNETPVILACKYAVSIEILESLLVSLRNMWPLEQVKEYLERKDSQEMKAFDFCKLKKRSDLAVVLAEFVDTTKSVLDIGFSYVEGFDFKAECKTLFSKELHYVQKQLEVKTQYHPIIEPFIKNNLKMRIDKCVGKQMKPLQYTPFLWVDSADLLN
jgi:hypothetical protein